MLITSCWRKAKRIVGGLDTLENCSGLDDDNSGKSGFGFHLRGCDEDAAFAT